MLSVKGYSYKKGINERPTSTSQIDIYLFFKRDVFQKPWWLYSVCSLIASCIHEARGDTASALNATKLPLKFKLSAADASSRKPKEDIYGHFTWLSEYILKDNDWRHKTTASTTGSAALERHTHACTCTVVQYCLETIFGKSQVTRLYAFPMWFQQIKWSKPKALINVPNLKFVQNVVKHTDVVSMWRSEEHTGRI